jgi:DNA-binding NtrC family response regulator
MTIMEDSPQPKSFPDAGASDLAEVLEAVSTFAPMQRAVLLVARRGTGPRLLAEVLHRASSRPKNVFVTVRCGLCPPSTVDRDLFGSRGVQKGNSRRTIGKILAAEGGTLFIEQIQNASPEAQRVLLRILEDHEFTVGATTRTVDIRIIVSAPASLESHVADGRFRADLFYQLNAVPIPVPAGLLTREGILAILASARRAGPYQQPPDSPPQDETVHAGRLEHAVRLALERVGSGSSPEDILLKTLAELQPRLPEAAARRQLEATVFRAASQCLANHASLGPRVYHLLVNEVQRALIRRAVDECNGMRTRAAALLGLTLQELENRMGDLGVAFSLPASG